MLKTENRVDAPSLSYKRQAERWKLIDDLDGGTRAMRAAGKEWLPAESKEDPVEYSARLNRSILYAALSETIDTAVSRPFAKPPSFQEAETLDERLALLEDDADRSGTSLSDFGRALFRDGLKYGRAHFLVDYPSVSTAATRRDELEGGVRPYFARVCPTDLIGWSTERGPDGMERVTAMRIRETVTEASGEFGEVEVEQIRYLTETEWRTYRKGEVKAEFYEHDRGEMTLGKIPLVTVYFKRTGTMESEPPYEPLAWLNLAHWQSMSDQRNLLRVARVPILAIAGLRNADKTNPIVVGSGNFLPLPDVDTKAFYVEHSGAALGAGRDDLKDLEERMEVLGLAPLTSRSGAVTATAKAIDESKSSSDLEAWARVMEYALFQGYELGAEWIRSELPKGFSIDLFSDFSLSLRSAEDATTLLGLYTAKAITAETLLSEFKRRGVLGQMVDPAEEAQAARDANPMPDLSGLLGLAPGQPPDDPDDGEDGEADPNAEGSASGQAA